MKWKFWQKKVEAKPVREYTELDLKYKQALFKALEDWVFDYPYDGAVKFTKPNSRSSYAIYVTRKYYEPKIDFYDFSTGASVSYGLLLNDEDYKQVLKEIEDIEQIFLTQKNAKTRYEQNLFADRLLS